MRSMVRCGALLGSTLVVGLFLIAWSGWGFGHSLFSHLCHQKSERCFLVGSSSLAVCSRCLGIYIGITGGCMYSWLRTNSALKLKYWVGSILALSALANLLDFGFEWFGYYENAIWTRSLLGLVLGASFSFFVLLRSSHSMGRKEKKTVPMRLHERG